MTKTASARMGTALGTIALLALLSPTTAKAQLTLGLDYEFGGGTPPVSSTTPWLTATFANNGANTVRLTMEAGNLTATEFVAGWYFNLNPALNPTALTFSAVNTSAAVVTGIEKGVNAYKADGDGFFDIRFNFQTASGAGRFTTGETLVYDISGISGITIADFNFINHDSKKPGGPFYSAAHVQSISNGQSGWIGASKSTEPPGQRSEPVPEPSTFVVLGSFVAAAIYLKRRQDSKKAITA